MDTFDDIIDPPNQARKMVIGMILTGLTFIAGFTLWYFLIHNKNTTSVDHEGHFACLFLHENPILLAATVFAVLFWASSKNS